MADAEETPSQRQARIRREKREKKILEGGSARLDKITSISGRPAEAPSPSPADKNAAPSTPSPLPSQPHPSSSPLSTSDPSAADLEASMRQLLRGPASTDQQQSSAADSAPQDPMLALLQQMMGANMPPTADGSIPVQQQQGQNPAFDGLPPGLAAMLGGLPPGAGNGAGVQATDGVPAKNVYIWKILHAVFSLLLGGYILYTYTFSGTLSSRLRDRMEDWTGIAAAGNVPSEGRLFWIFVTAELGLQGGRFLLDGGREEMGMVGTVAGFLPEPWGTRVKLGSRYLGIWNAMATDALVVVFLLGAAAWWKGDGGLS